MRLQSNVIMTPMLDTTDLADVGEDASTIFRTVLRRSNCSATHTKMTLTRYSNCIRYTFPLSIFPQIATHVNNRPPKNPMGRLDFGLRQSLVKHYCTNTIQKIRFSNEQVQTKILCNETYHRDGPSWRLKLQAPW